MRRDCDGGRAKSKASDKSVRPTQAGSADDRATEDRRLIMFDTFPLWPARASTTAGSVDALFIFLVALSALMSVAIFTMIVVFAVRYRRRRGVEGRADRRLDRAGSDLVGDSPLYFRRDLRVGRGDLLQGAHSAAGRDRGVRRGQAVDVEAAARRRASARSTNCTCPLGRDVKLILTSQDVIHSFYVPAFRIKQDVLPGRYTTAWFHPTKAGTYHLFCAEYCGSQHSGMIGQVVVLEPAQYEAWLSGGGASGTMASNGQNIFQQLGCSTCHRSDTQGRGPNLVGSVRQARATGRRAHRHRR